MSVMIGLVCFFGGFVFSRFMEAISAVTVSEKVLHKLKFEMLKSISNIYAERIQLNNRVVLKMTEAGSSESEIKVIKNEQDYDLMAWKKESIQNFRESYPETFKHRLEINNWDEAMNQMLGYYLSKEGVFEKIMKDIENLNDEEDKSKTDNNKRTP